MKSKILSNLRKQDWKNPAYRKRMRAKLRAAWRRGRETRTKYGEVGAAHPRELKAFSAMFDRVKAGQAPGIEWTRSKKDFVEFLSVVGPYPKSMRRPSIGRRSHKLPYGRENVAWEEFSLNASKNKDNASFPPAFKKQMSRLMKRAWKQGKFKNRKTRNQHAS
jgi:uncharacterized protein (DUF736 family)